MKLREATQIIGMLENGKFNADLSDDIAKTLATLLEMSEQSEGHTFKGKTVVTLNFAVKDGATIIGAKFEIHDAGSPAPQHHALQSRRRYAVHRASPPNRYVLAPRRCGGWRAHQQLTYPPNPKRTPTVDQLTQTAVEAIAKLAEAAQIEVTTISLPSTIKGAPSSIPVLLDRKTGAVKDISGLIAPWRDAPQRKTGTATVHTLESFVELVNLHKQDNSVIFADTDWQKPSMTAVIDYHGETTPDNGKHRVHYQFPLSEEWEAWLKLDNKAMTQIEFAEFIEEHISDLAAPQLDEVDDFKKMFGFEVAHPADIIALSRGLQINADTRIKQHVKLQSGETQIMFEEDHKGADGQPLIIPGLFILQIAPFFMGTACRIPVRLRYRPRNGSVQWTYQLYRPDRYITDQVRTDLDRAAEETGLQKFEGTPEMSAA